jgi:hypothetical protein
MCCAAAINACSDAILTEKWIEGQRRACQLAWALGMRPPSMAAHPSSSLPGGILEGALPHDEQWFATPWAEEVAALSQMRAADEDDQGGEDSMTGVVQPDVHMR